MRSAIRELKLNHQTQLSLQDIARQLNPLLRGWIEYYGDMPHRRCTRARYVKQTLVAWAMRKFKRFKELMIQASQFLQRLATEHRSLLYTGILACPECLLDGSRTRREVHVRFCERLEAKFLGPTLPRCLI